MHRINYGRDDSHNPLLSELVVDHIQEESILWLLLYVGKIRDAHTWQDMMIEAVRLLPYSGVTSFDTWMDALFKFMDLTKEKTAVAQSMLNRIFQAQDKQPFPLSFSRWAVDNGANINHPAQHAVVQAAIDNELLYAERGDAFHKDGNPPLLPLIDDIAYFLHDSGFFFKGVDQGYILQTAEDPDVADSVLARLRSRLHNPQLLGVSKILENTEYD